MLVAGRRYRRRPRGNARLCAGGRRAGLHPPDRARSRARRQPRRRPRRNAASAPPPPPITTRSCCSGSWPAAPRRSALPSGVLILAQRQAVLVAKQAASPRRAVRRPLPARDRGRLERGRVHRPQRGFPQSRQTLGRPGAGHAGLVGRAACPLCRRVSPDRRCRHQPAAGFGPRADLVWRPRRGDLPALLRDMATASCHWPIRRATRRSPRSRNCAGWPAKPAATRRRSASKCWVSPGAGGPDEWRREVQFWKAAGVTHLTAHTTYVSGHHQRIAGHSAAEHLAAITRYREAVADLL